MDKSQMLDRLHEQHRRWKALLDEIGPRRMDQPGVNGDWSMKDLVAHLTVWQRRPVGELKAAQRGETEPPLPWPAHLQTEDEINAWIYETNRRRPVGDVLAESESLFQELFAAIEGLPEDVRVEHIEPKLDVVWVGDKRVPPGELFYHFEDDHEPAVQAWLQRVSEEEQGK